MYKINLQKYVDELSSIHSFYIYSKDAFENDNLRQEIIEKEYINMFNTALSFIKDGEEAAKLIKQSEKNIRDQVERKTSNGLEVLRQQLLEASYSKDICYNKFEISITKFFIIISIIRLFIVFREAKNDCL